MATDAHVSPSRGLSSPTPKGLPLLLTEEDVTVTGEETTPAGEVSLDVTDSVTPEEDVSVTEEKKMSEGETLVVPEIVRAKSAPNHPSGKLGCRSPEVSFRRLECRSAEDMMMGTSQFGGDLNDYFSTLDPSQFHFYDFGIQDFLVMKNHQHVDMGHEEEDVQQGDYNCGLNVSPRPYLSDSDLSDTSIELSSAQVLWEKKLLDEASVLRNVLLKRGRQQAVAMKTSHHGRLRDLTRRATELCFGHGHQRTKNVVRRIFARPVSVTEMGVTDENCLLSNQSSLDAGDDCTTIDQPSLDIGDDCEAPRASSPDSNDNSEVHSGLANGDGDTKVEPEAELAS